MATVECPRRSGFHATRLCLADANKRKELEMQQYAPHQQRGTESFKTQSHRELAQSAHEQQYQHDLSSSPTSNEFVSAFNLDQKKHATVAHGRTRPLLKTVQTAEAWMPPDLLNCSVVGNSFLATKARCRFWRSFVCRTFNRNFDLHSFGGPSFGLSQSLFFSSIL